MTSVLQGYVDELVEEFAPKIPNTRAYVNGLIRSNAKKFRKADLEAYFMKQVQYYRKDNQIYLACMCAIMLKAEYPALDEESTNIMYFLINSVRTNPAMAVTKFNAVRRVLLDSGILILPNDAQELYGKIKKEYPVPVRIGDVMSIKRILNL